MTAQNGLTPDANALGAEMLAAARAALANRTPALQVMAEAELRRLAGALADIGSMLASGDLDPDRAKLLANIHQLAFRTVLRSVEGLGILPTEHAMQAVTRVAAGAVNPIVGFKLI
ncbi:MAG TPA: hypothetical protein VFP80_15845 [Thermoanaerobaculia bacterium]|nr:hypothetical protein [Thermoanaerobaculia bacterium]